MLVTCLLRDILLYFKNFYLKIYSYACESNGPIIIIYDFFCNMLSIKASKCKLSMYII